MSVFWHVGKYTSGDQQKPGIIKNEIIMLVYVTSTANESRLFASSSVDRVNKPLSPNVSALLCFCMVYLQLGQDAEQADWWQESTPLT